MEETNALQDLMEEEIDEPESSLDEKEEESDEQKEEEWISYPCLPSNESNSLSLTLFDCPPCLPKEDECYAHVICDNPLFVPNFEMHGTKEFFLENVYDKALDDGPILNDQSSCYRIVKSGFEGFNPTIFELDKNYVFVDHEKHTLCDSYIVEFIHDATENYYERGKYGCRSFHGTETPHYVLNVLKLLLFYLPTLVTMCLFDLFSYKIPMHRKWVRLKCVLNFLLDALFYLNSYVLCEHPPKLSCLT